MKTLLGPLKSTEQDQTQIFLKPCSKDYGMHVEKEQKTSNAVTYLNLREQGCKKKKAVNFSNKQYCKYDTTRQRDGPNSHRVLKPSQDTVSYNINGWNVSGDVDFYVSKNSSYNPYVSNDEDQVFQKISNSLKTDPTSPAAIIGNLNNYYQNLSNTIRSPSNLTALQKLEWVKQLKDNIDQDQETKRFIPIEIQEEEIDTKKRKKNKGQSKSVMSKTTLKLYEIAKFATNSNNNYQYDDSNNFDLGATQYSSQLMLNQSKSSKNANSKSYNFYTQNNNTISTDNQEYFNDTNTSQLNNNNKNNININSMNNFSRYNNHNYPQGPFIMKELNGFPNHLTDNLSERIQVENSGFVKTSEAKQQGQGDKISIKGGGSQRKIDLENTSIINTHENEMETSVQNIMSYTNNNVNKSVPNLQLNKVNIDNSISSFQVDESQDIQFPSIRKLSQGSLADKSIIKNTIRKIGGPGSNQTQSQQDTFKKIGKDNPYYTTTEKQQKGEEKIVSFNETPNMFKATGGNHLSSVQKSSHNKNSHVNFTEPSLVNEEDQNELKEDQKNFMKSSFSKMANRVSASSFSKKNMNSSRASNSESCYFNYNNQNAINSSREINNNNNNITINTNRSSARGSQTTLKLGQKMKNMQRQSGIVYFLQTQQKKRNRMSVSFKKKNSLDQIMNSKQKKRTSQLTKEEIEFEKNEKLKAIQKVKEQELNIIKQGGAMDYNVKTGDDILDHFNVELKGWVQKNIQKNYNEIQSELEKVKSSKNDLKNDNNRKLNQYGSSSIQNSKFEYEEDDDEDSDKEESYYESRSKIDTDRQIDSQMRSKTEANEEDENYINLQKLSSRSNMFDNLYNIMTEREHQKQQFYGRVMSKTPAKKEIKQRRLLANTFYTNFNQKNLKNIEDISPVKN